MDTAVKTKEIDVVILCGGKGDRLKLAVCDRPKAMAEINGRPFLDILIDYIASFGFVRFILCIGYMGDVIEQHYLGKKNNLEILFSADREPLGTAGAIKKAEVVIKSSPFLVINGDSFCQVDLKSFASFHLNKNAFISIVVTKAKERNDYGSVTLGDFQRIDGFKEKTGGNKDSFINGGAYLFQKEALSFISAGQSASLERDVFPGAIASQRIFGYITDGLFIDIGIPERYQEAKQIFSKKIIKES